MLTDSLKSRMPATSLQLFGIRQIEEDNMATCEYETLISCSVNCQSWFIWGHSTNNFSKLGADVLLLQMYPENISGGIWKHNYPDLQSLFVLLRWNLRECKQLLWVNTQSFKWFLSDLLFVLQISVTRSFPHCFTLLLSTAWRSWPPFSFSVPGLCRLTAWWTSLETTQTRSRRRVASLTSDSSWMNLL